MSDATSRRCPDCGELLAPGEAAHAHGSSADIETLKVGGTTARRAPEMPPEVREAAKDPHALYNQYVLVAEVGRGGMGTVWKAYDRSLLRWVAVKFLNDTDEDSLRRFHREAQIAARVRHPHIAPIFEVGESRGRHFIAMEFIAGRSMDKVKLPVREIVEIMANVCDGVEAANRAGVIHRDLKPQNVMLTDERWPYVTDFGLAKALTDSSLSVSGAVLGTPAYMSPEQAEGRLDLIDARTDVYGLGATLYALLVGRPPFGAETPLDTLVQVTRDDPPAPSAINPEVPQQVQNVVLKALEKSKARRYSSAADFAADLRRWLANASVMASTPNPMRLAARRIARHPWAVTLALLAALGAVIAFTVGRSKRTGAGDVWVAEWQRLRGPLAFETFDPKADGAALCAHLARMRESAKPSDADLVAEWFGRQLDAANTAVPADRKLWLEHREAAARVVAWAGAVKAAIAGVDALAPLGPNLDFTRQKAERVSAWRGMVRLRVFVWPYARVSGPGLGPADTPAVFEEVEIGDFELTLEHPQHGKRTVAVKDLENGGTYTVVGRMDAPETLRLLR